MVDSSNILLEETVPARQGWAHRITTGDTLVITDLEGQQAVDYLCFDADGDAATNTFKVPGNVHVGLGTVPNADSGNALMTVVTDTIGRHDGILRLQKREFSDHCDKNATAYAQIALATSVLQALMGLPSIPLDKRVRRRCARPGA